MSKEYVKAKPEDIANLLYEVYDVPSGICDQIKNMEQRLESIDNANPSEVLIYVKMLVKASNTEKHFLNLSSPDIRNLLIEIKQALERLESIDNSKPSEALECFKRLSNEYKLYDELKGEYFETTEESKTIWFALLKAQEQKKELKEQKELLEEIKCLYQYKDFAKLMFDIFGLEYLKEYFTLIMQPQEPYKIEENELRICLTEEDANKVLKVAELLESENGVEQE